MISMISISCLPFLLFHKAIDLTAVQEVNPKAGDFPPNLALDSEIPKAKILQEQMQYSWGLQDKAWNPWRGGELG